MNIDPTVAGSAGGSPFVPGSAGLSSEAIAGLGLRRTSVDPVVAGQMGGDLAVPAVAGPISADGLQPPDGLAQLMVATLEHAREQRARQSQPVVVYEPYIPPLHLHARNPWGCRELVARYRGSHADLAPVADPPHSRWRSAGAEYGGPRPASARAAFGREPDAATPALALFQAPPPASSPPASPPPASPAASPAASPTAVPSTPVPRAPEMPGPAMPDPAPLVRATPFAVEAAEAVEAAGVAGVGALLAGVAVLVGGMLVPLNRPGQPRSAPVQGHPELDAEVTIPPGSLYPGGPVILRKAGPGGTAAGIGTLTPDQQGGLHDGAGGPILATFGTDGIIRLSAEGERRFGGPPKPPPMPVRDPKTGAIYIIGDAQESEIVTGGIAQGWPPSRIQQALDAHRNSRRSPATAGGAPPSDQGPPVPPPAPPQALPPPPLTARQQVEALPGHGDPSHGPRTLPNQHTRRLLTGIAPDGRRSPTKTSTGFDSDEAELDAVERARRKVEADDKAGTRPRFRTSKRGILVPGYTSVVVTGFPGGYGSGVSLEGSRNLIQTVVPTGQLQNALVQFVWDPGRGEWVLDSQYPTAQEISK